MSASSENSFSSKSLIEIEQKNEHDLKPVKKENLISKNDPLESKYKSSKKAEKERSHSDSSSDSDSSKKKKSKITKKKKDKKEKKIHKSNKDKKKKKHHKKHHKKHKNKSEKYGKYGIITMIDMPMKKEDFMHWLREVKSINIEEITHTQEKKYFEEYMEDYNTCSFPSKKFYNIREWEMKQENTKEREFRAINNNDSMALFMTDEANLMEERKKKNLQFQMDKVHAALYQLNNNQEMIQGMKEEQELKDKMKHYYKIGKIDEAQKISKLFEVNKQFKE